MPDYDLFISYRRKDADRVLPLVEALSRKGLTVWFDQHTIGEFAPITDEIRDGLAPRIPAAFSGCARTATRRPGIEA